MKHRTWLVLAVMAAVTLSGPTTAAQTTKSKARYAELDPLRMIDSFRDITRKAGPNVVIAVDLSPRMLSDANGIYYDPKTWDKEASAAARDAATSLGVPAGARYYKRAYTLLKRRKTGASETYTANSIAVVPETSAAQYRDFSLLSRLGMARDGLAQTVDENISEVRFGIVRMRQGANATWPATAGNKTPVTLEDSAQKQLAGDNLNKTWKVTFPVTTSDNIDAGPKPADVLVSADAANASANTLSRLESEPDENLGLKPYGLDENDFFDSPVTNLLVDTKAEVERLMDRDDALLRPCRNTVVILVVGGGDGGKGKGKPSDPSKVAETFTSIMVKGVTRSVPIYVIAVGPPSSEVGELKAIATASGGEYFEVDSAHDVAWAGNYAVQSAYRHAPDVDAQAFTEFQSVHPVVGTVDLAGAKDIDGSTLPYTRIKATQENNLLLTSGFTMPGFEGSLRAFRAYRPEPDKTQNTGYKFISDGTPLWVAHLPGATHVGSPVGDGMGGKGGTLDAGSWKSGATVMANGYKAGNPDKRNIYTFLPGTGMVAFTAANASTLRPYLKQATDADAQRVIAAVRAHQIGAIVTSRPAVLGPPTLEPPDADYTKFAYDRKRRRTIIFVGGNNGMIHAIDARLGVEVWAFIPFNQIPKLKSLVRGQSVGYFEYFVDSPPRLADVKVGGVWRTYLMFGQGMGGTFYQTFDVSDAGLGLATDSDSETAVLAAFKSTTAISFKWSFPDYAQFDYTYSSPNFPYGDLKASASADEKSVGETWSAPVMGQLVNATGKWAALVGSGYLWRNNESLPHRNGTKAGTKFYVLDIASGALLSRQDVGDQPGSNNFKNSLTADPAVAGPSRFIDRAFIGDTEGHMYRFVVSSAGVLSAPVAIWSELHTTIFTSASVSPAGGSSYYVFFATGIDTVPLTKHIGTFKLVGVLDTGAAASVKFEVSLQKTDGKAADERPTSAPVVAGNAVYFTTTTDFPLEACRPAEAALYAMSFGGGPAFDTNGDKVVDNKDKVVLTQPVGRSTGLFVSDQHLYFGTGSTVEIFGDPEDFNNGLSLMTARMLSWREIR